MITFQSRDAKSRFGHILDVAQHEPVKITRNGKTFAYVISPNEFESSHMTSDPYVLFSQGRLSSARAVKLTGVRDYATFLIELGKRGLPLPSLDDSTLTKMSETFIGLMGSVAK